MANSKNYGLNGVASQVQLGKAGGKLDYSTANTEFSAFAADGTTLVPVKGGAAVDPDHLITLSAAEALIAASAGDTSIALQSVSLTATGPVSIGTVPANRTISKITLTITTATDTAATITVGTTGTPALLMAANENDPQVLGVYISNTFETVGVDTEIFITVTHALATTGTAKVLVEFES